MTKRIVSFIASIALLICIMVPAQAAESGKEVINPFTDVKSGAFYCGAILWAVDSGITKGTSNTTFSPSSTCTRGQVVTFLWRNAGSPHPKTAENPFSDVNALDFFFEPVLWAVEKGITKGTTNTTFSPQDECTTAQILTFLWRANGVPKSEDSDLSKNYVGEYYERAVAWADCNGILSYTNKTFNPSKESPRYEIVTFMYNNAGKPEIRVAGAEDPFDVALKMVKEKGYYDSDSLYYKADLLPADSEKTLSIWCHDGSEPIIVLSEECKDQKIPLGVAVSIKRFQNGKFAYSFVVSGLEHNMTLQGALDAETFNAETDLLYCSYSGADSEKIKPLFCELSAQYIADLLQRAEYFAFSLECEQNVSIRDFGFTTAYKEAWNVR